MKTVVHVVGARPNFMKLAPVYNATVARGVLRQRVVHTGQHYDEKMSEVFFRDLGLPVPDMNLGIGSGSQGEQTARALVELERAFMTERPDLLSVFGDVNSTLSATLAAAKMRVPVAHVEAGLRSFDRTMPEEINRIVVDCLADFLLTPSPDADANLRHEGVPDARIFRVGNVMIDTLVASLPAAKKLGMPQRLGLAGDFAVCTLHRPANVDDPDVLPRILTALEEIGRQVPIVFPAHPRTRARMSALGLSPNGLKVIDPLGYLEFLSLSSAAALVLTDSGGLQEESTALGIPCLTLRANTERPVTVDEGTNTVVGTDPRRIIDEARRALHGDGKRGHVPALWDGHTGERIAVLYERVV